MYFISFIPLTSFRFFVPFFFIRFSFLELFWWILFRLGSALFSQFLGFVLSFRTFELILHLTFFDPQRFHGTVKYSDLLLLAFFQWFLICITASRIWFIQYVLCFSLPIFLQSFSSPWSAKSSRFTSCLQSGAAASCDYSIWIPSKCRQSLTLCWNRLWPAASTTSADYSSPALMQLASYADTLVS